MRKWKLLLAGMMLMLSLSAVAGCGNNNANDKNNGTNGTNTSTENRLNNNADTTGIAIFSKFVQSLKVP